MKLRFIGTARKLLFVTFALATTAFSQSQCYTFKNATSKQVTVNYQPPPGVSVGAGWVYQQIFEPAREFKYCTQFSVTARIATPFTVWSNQQPTLVLGPGGTPPGAYQMVSKTAPYRPFKQGRPATQEGGGYDRKDYGVKMNDAGSQWFHLDFHVSPNGHIHVHERLTNDVYYSGWCGTFSFKLSDVRDDRTLFQADSPEACVGGKGFGGHEQTNYAEWDIDMDPNLAKQFIAYPSEWAGKKTLRGY